MAFSWILRKDNQDPVPPRRRRVRPEVHDSIQLRIQDGLLMAFGPENDPLPPALLRTVSKEGPTSFLERDSGQAVDCERVLTVFKVQQRGALSDRPGDGWIKAMLGLEGSFEQTPRELLEQEPNDPLPNPPFSFAENQGDDWLEESLSAEELEDDASRDGNAVTITFDAAEQARMKHADVLLFQGLDESVTLSAGHFDPELNAWILRPDDIDALTLEAAENAPRSFVIDVEAIIVHGDGDRWPVGRKIIDLA